MYNPQIKNQYLQEKSDLTRKQMEQFFNKLEEFEIEYGKDISDFTLNEITTALIQMQPKNEPQAKTYCSFINGYRRWVKNTDENIFKNVHEDYYLQFL